MTKTPNTKMQQIADEMSELYGLDFAYGEYGFTSRATSLIQSLIRDSHIRAGLKPPTTKRIEGWLYKPKVPDLAIVLVNECWRQKKEALKAGGSKYG